MKRREFLTQTLPALAVTPLLPLPSATKAGAVAAQQIQAALGQEWLAEIDETVELLQLVREMIAAGKAEAEAFYDAVTLAQVGMDTLALMLADSRFESLFVALTGEDQWFITINREIAELEGGRHEAELNRWRRELAGLPEPEAKRLLALVEEKLLFPLS